MRCNGFTHINPILMNVVQSIQDRADGILLNEPDAWLHVQSSAFRQEFCARNPIAVASGLSSEMDSLTDDFGYLAYVFALHTAGVRRLPVLIIGKGGARTEIGFRLLCLQGQLPFWNVAMGDLDDDDWMRMSQALGVLHDAPLYVNVDDGLTIDSTCRLIKNALMSLYSIGGVVIENLDRLMVSEGMESSSKEREAIWIRLKSLSRDINAPIIGTLCPTGSTAKPFGIPEGMIRLHGFDCLGVTAYPYLLRNFSLGTDHGCTLPVVPSDSCVFWRDQYCGCRRQIVCLSGTLSAMI